MLLYPYHAIDQQAALQITYGSLLITSQEILAASSFLNKFPSQSLTEQFQAKIDKTSALNEPDHCMFIVQDPQITHEFRTSSLEESEHWVQHIKNATVSETLKPFNFL